MQIIFLNYASHIIAVELIRSKNASVMYALHTWFMDLIQKATNDWKKYRGPNMGNGEWIHSLPSSKQIRVKLNTLEHVTNLIWAQ